VAQRLAAVVGVSGLLELAALCWWGAHLARSMFGPVGIRAAPVIPQA
jgi:hypothetical protein